MSYTDRELIAIARAVLSSDELDVWMSKHIHGYGRRSGSLNLGISEETWRHRLSTATRKINTYLEKRGEAA